MIVDDSALVRKMLTEFLVTDPGIEVIGYAPDPIIAMRKMEKDKPDVLLLDIEMPRMDGLTFLSHIMETDPLPVIICSSVTEQGAENTLKALQLGAIGVIPKSSLNLTSQKGDAAIQLTEAVKGAAAAKGKIKRITNQSQEHSAVVIEAKIKQQELTATLNLVPQAKLNADAILSKPGGRDQSLHTAKKIIAIGSSTGGPEALQIILPMFLKNSPPILITQHMPSPYTAAFAKRLNTFCEIEVREAKDKDPVLPGVALIAPGDQHMLLQHNGKDFFIQLVDGPLVSRHRPSVDVLFRSVARAAGKSAVGCIMTGMGDDGATGLKEMLEAGALTFAQDEESCVVFGMPMQAWKRGGAQKLVSLKQIPATLLEAIQQIK